MFNEQGNGEQERLQTMKKECVRERKSYFTVNFTLSAGIMLLPACINETSKILTTLTQKPSLFLSPFQIIFPPTEEACYSGSQLT